MKVMGAKTDLEIFGLIAKEMGLEPGHLAARQSVRGDPQDGAWLRCAAAGDRHRRRGSDDAAERPRGGAAGRRFTPPGDTLFTSGIAVAIRRF